MREIRIDPATGRQVIIAEGRMDRPSDYYTVSYQELFHSNEASKEESIGMIEECGCENDVNPNCPFCPGNEHDTPSQKFIISECDQWKLRVVENKYPIFNQSENEFIEQNSVLSNKKGMGIHEVVVETRKHSNNFYNMNVNDFIDILNAYKNRLTELLREKDICYVNIFKNHNKEAGASLMHSHSQIIAANLIPNDVMNELKRTKAYYDKNKCCMYCDILKHELEIESRLVSKTDNYIAFAPYASRFMYELKVMPTNHEESFEYITEDKIIELAKMLYDIFKKIHIVLGDAAFNMYLNTIPKMDEEYNKSYHWSINIIPRFGTLAGFEISSGMNTNSLSPEKAAAKLRTVRHT